MAQTSWKRGSNIKTACLNIEAVCLLLHQAIFQQLVNKAIIHGEISYIVISCITDGKQGGQYKIRTVDHGLWIGYKIRTTD